MRLLGLHAISMARAREATRAPCLCHRPGQVGKDLVRIAAYGTQARTCKKEGASSCTRPRLPASRRMHQPPGLCTQRQKPVGRLTCNARRARRAELPPGALLAAPCQVVGQRGCRAARLGRQHGRPLALALVACRSMPPASSSHCRGPPGLPIPAWWPRRSSQTDACVGEQTRSPHTARQVTRQAF